VFTWPFRRVLSDPWPYNTFISICCDGPTKSLRNRRVLTFKCGVSPYIIFLTSWRKSSWQDPVLLLHLRWLIR